MIIRCLLLITLSLNHVIQCSEVNRPRGVALSKKIFYDPRKDFSCLDGSAVLPFNQVNDDYCDCADGSDEPGTAACTDGVFHCPNVGFIPKNIKSSRVNDGICDCCDASDEYRPGSHCANTCLKLGEASREERRRFLQLLREGSEIRSGFIEEAKSRRDQEQVDLKRLTHELKDLEEIKLEKDAVKRAAEEKEKSVLQKYREIEDQKKQEAEEAEVRKNEVREQLLAEQAFKHLDSDQDGRLTFTELTKFPVFDQNGDNFVSDDEAKFFLHMKNEMDLEEWKSIGWVIAKPYYLKLTADAGDKHEDEPEVITAATPVAGDQHIDDELDDLEMFGDRKDQDHDSESKHEQEDDEEEDEDDPGQHYSPDTIPDVPKGMPVVSSADSSIEYDEETKEIIAEAKKAKDEFTDADNKWNEVRKQIELLTKSQETDFGPDSSFLPLYGQCFEMTDREYVYKLCPFDKASQRPKDGGSDTSLGRWGKWVHADDQKYHMQKYESGATCWNGPARSVDVSIGCGLKNEIVSASEPNRCEYAMRFLTPALCLKEDSIMTSDGHDHSHEEL